MFAARNGNPQAIKVLLEAGADVNARETLRGTTALMWAVEQKHPEAVKALLAAGADLSAKSGGAGLPRNYMANRVNLRAVAARAGPPQARGGGGPHLRRAARDRAEGGPRGRRQRGLGQALGPDGQPLPQGGRQGGAGSAGAAPHHARHKQRRPAPAPPAAPRQRGGASGRGGASRGGTRPGRQCQAHAGTGRSERQAAQPAGR